MQRKSSVRVHFMGNGWASTNRAVTGHRVRMGEPFTQHQRGVWGIGLDYTPRSRLHLIEYNVHSLTSNSVSHPLSNVPCTQATNNPGARPADPYANQAATHAESCTSVQILVFDLLSSFLMLVMLTTPYLQAGTLIARSSKMTAYQMCPSDGPGCIVKQAVDNERARVGSRVDGTVGAWPCPCIIDEDGIDSELIITDFCFDGQVRVATDDRNWRVADRKPGNSTVRYGV